MPTLMQEMTAKALRLGVPISVQLDVTYRCNERCVHCYLDHDDHGEMTLAEMRDVLDQMAEAGVFFLTISGGEVLMRMDFFDILAHARARMFSVKVKTNAFMIREAEADRLARAGLASVQVSIYSHRSGDSRRDHEAAAADRAVDRGNTAAAGARSWAPSIRSIRRSRR